VPKAGPLHSVEEVVQSARTIGKDFARYHKIILTTS
jgi:hypothetical protein